MKAKKPWISVDTLQMIEADSRHVQTNIFFEMELDVANQSFGEVWSHDLVERAFEGRRLARDP